MKGRYRALLWLCLLLLTAAGFASANGMPLPVPAAGGRLTLDLRDEPGRITASYELQNRGSSTERVTIAFLVAETPGITSPPSVTLDGQALPVGRAARARHGSSRSPWGPVRRHGWR